MKKILLLTILALAGCQTTNHHRSDLVADELVSFGADTQVQRLKLQRAESHYISLSDKPLKHGNIFLRVKNKAGKTVMLKMPEHPIKFYNMAMKHKVFSNKNPQSVAMKLIYDFVPIKKSTINQSKRNLRKSSGGNYKMNRILEKEYKWILGSAVDTDLKNIHKFMKSGKNQTHRFILFHQKLAAALSRVRLLYEMNSNYYERMAIEIKENDKRRLAH